jgi:lipoprotein
MIKKMLMASLVVGFLGGMVTLTGCEKDTKKGGGEEQTENAREVALKAANAEFVDKVVIPTYTDLAAAAKKLDDLVIALEADVNATNIKAACDQWFIAVRCGRRARRSYSGRPRSIILTRISIRGLWMPHHCRPFSITRNS